MVMIMSKARTTKQWQRLDTQNHLHPFTDYHAYNQKPGRVINVLHLYL